MSKIVLSHWQAKQLLTAKSQAGTWILISLDLGLTETQVEFHQDGIELPDGEGKISWEQLSLIAKDESCCYQLQRDEIIPIRLFSENTGWVYSLMPTQRAPTLLISGIPMHRFKGTDPYQDTIEKIKASGAIFGKVLDTATGLGYTAIQAAKKAVQVVTIERDAEVIQIARQNPWSQELFNNPKIIQIIGDSYQEITAFGDGEFRIIIHDPPAFHLSGELYSLEFYQQAWRVLNHKGKMFHYIGDPSSKMGAGVMRGVIRRLIEAGFSQVIHKPNAFGVLAFK